MGKNQHYVPQFYLKQFSNDNRSVGTWAANINKIIPHASISNMASKANLYGKDQIIERSLAAEERKWSIILHRINEAKSIDSFEDFFDLLDFIMISNSRTLKMAEQVNYMNEFFAKLMLNGRILEEELKQMNFEEEIPNLIPMQVAIENTPILYDLDWVLLENRTPASFITTDNPVCLYNPLYIARKYDRNYGMGAGGLVILISLSGEKCLCLYDPMVYQCGESNVVSIKSSSAATEINKLLIRNAYQNIFFNNNQKESYIKSLVKHYVSTPKEKCIKVHMGGNLIQYGGDSIHDYFKLDFLTIKQEYMEMELPLHLGGLSRPLAEQKLRKSGEPGPISNEMWKDIAKHFGREIKK